MDLRIETIPPQGFASNTFAVTADGKNCILIDCAQPRVAEVCRALGLVPRAVLLTHGHFDHVGGCAALQQIGALIYCGELEKGFIFSEENLSVFGGVEIPRFTVDGTLEEGKHTICGIEVEVIATPGHTAGGVCYVIGKNIFSGDTLFAGSVGRTDLPTGDSDALVKSVKKLYALGGDYTVYCGHGENTTLDFERRFNMYVRA